MSLTAAAMAVSLVTNFSDAGNNKLITPESLLEDFSINEVIESEYNAKTQTRFKNPEIAQTRTQYCYGTVGNDIMCTND